MNLAPSSSIFSGLPIRDLLRHINTSTTNSDIQIALALIFGTNQQTRKARKLSHLTHATEVDHQIRYPLKARVDRSILKLASFSADQLLQNSISEISVNISKDDYISQIFFSCLRKNGIRIQINSSLLNSEISIDLLNSTEQQILRSIQINEMNLDFILKYAQERIYAGDYSSAYCVLIKFDPSDRNDICHHILGLCCNFFGNTIESEVHFRRLLASGNILSKVKAAYVLSMLYLRLHPKDNQDLNTAEQLLIDSHQLIEANTTMKDYYFHSVFNRNGYALCLFRRGQIDDALEMLNLGIEKLKNSDDGAKCLHQSVLIYNAVQCFKALQRYEECEELCKNLLEIDPLFPEYWLELSIIHLQQDDFKAALVTLNKAEELDAFIPEIYALRGYTYLNQNKLEFAVRNYRKAVALDPHNATYMSDLDYCLNTEPANNLENII